MAALAIRSEFEAAAHRAGHPLADFRIGLGIATGRAVAGKIGTVDQVTRKIARVRPYGMDTALLVSELLPSASEFALLTEEHLAGFESAVDAMAAGNWNAAMEKLHRVPAEDRVKDFLTVYMARHDRTPPPHWDGIMALDQK
jgi:adenylate cyclase